MRNDVLAFVATAIGLFSNQAEAVAANPLPKPQNITWGSSGPLSVGSLRLDAPEHKVLQAAFNRATKAITDLKWIPQATEAPVRSFEPFPTSTASRRKRQTYGNSTATLTTVKVAISDTHATLHHGVDESYTLDITSGSSEIKISAQTVYGALRAVGR